MACMYLDDCRVDEESGEDIISIVSTLIKLYNIFIITQVGNVSFTLSERSKIQRYEKGACR